MSKPLRMFKSIFGNSVVLTVEALNHILARHPELQGITELQDEIRRAVEEPDHVVKGVHGEHIAVRRYQESKYLIVPYEEGGEVRTAFITSEVSKILKRGVLWKRS